VQNLSDADADLSHDQNYQLLYRVPTPPGNSWKVLDFFLKFLDLESPRKSTLVLESPGKISLKITHFLLVLIENKQK